MSPADAASRAWLAVVRKGVGNRALADALVEAFDVLGPMPPIVYVAEIDAAAERRDDWQRVVLLYRSVASWAPFCAAACARFDLVP